MFQKGGRRLSFAPTGGHRARSFALMSTGDWRSKCSRIMGSEAWKNEEGEWDRAENSGEVCEHRERSREKGGGNAHSRETFCCFFFPLHVGVYVFIVKIHTEVEADKWGRVQEGSSRGVLGRPVDTLGLLAGIGHPYLTQICIAKKTNCFLHWIQEGSSKGQHGFMGHGNPLAKNEGFLIWWHLIFLWLGGHSIGYEACRA